LNDASKCDEWAAGDGETPGPFPDVEKWRKRAVNWRLPPAYTQGANTTALATLRSYIIGGQSDRTLMREGEIGLHLRPDQLPRLPLGQ